MEQQQTTIFEASSSLIGIKDLAKRTGMPLTWLKAATKRGELPGLRAGGKVRYSLAAVQLALQAMATKAVPQLERSANAKPPVRRRPAVVADEAVGA